MRLFAILRPLYEAAQDAMRLVAVDEWQLTQTEDPVSRHDLLREIAGLLEPQGADGPGYAFHALVRALGEPGPESALEALDAGKHVMVEIPMADSLAGVQEIVDVQADTGRIAMAGRAAASARRFSRARLLASQPSETSLSSGSRSSKVPGWRTSKVAPSRCARRCDCRRPERAEPVRSNVVSGTKPCSPSL